MTRCRPLWGLAVVVVLGSAAAGCTADQPVGEQTRPAWVDSATASTIEPALSRGDSTTSAPDPARSESLVPKPIATLPIGIGADAPPVAHSGALRTS